LWPDEPTRIDKARASFVYTHGGAKSHDLLLYANEKGYLTPDHGLEVQVSVICDWVGAYCCPEAEDAWRTDDAWRVDVAPYSWIYVEGHDPEQVKFATFGQRIEEVPLGLFFPYHGMPHRTPRASESGWRYSMRIVHAPPGGLLNRVVYRNSVSKTFR